MQWVTSIFRPGVLPGQRPLWVILGWNQGPIELRPELHHPRVPCSLRQQEPNDSGDILPLCLIVPISNRKGFNKIISCSVAKSCQTLCDRVDCSMPVSPALHCLLEFVQTHVHWVSYAIRPLYPLPPSSFFAFTLSQHQDLFQWVDSSHQVAKVLELQHQHRSFQRIFRIDLL